MVVPVFREVAFIWACAALAGGCLVVAVAVWARHFLRKLPEQFIRLPPSSKAMLVAAVVVATVFAQKPTSVSTNQPESAQVETAHTEERSHGEGEEGEATNQHESARIEICEDPCQSVDKDSSELRASVSPCEKIVTSNDVVRGYRLETVRTNATDFRARPTNARLVGTWHLSDAYEAVTRVQLLSTNLHESAPISIRENSCQFVANSPRPFRFPIGGHVVTSLWAHTWGKVRPQLRNASNEIVVICAPMFARHDRSFLWTATNANGSVLLTWQNFFLGNPYERLSTNLHESTRISIRENSCQFVDHPPVSAQLELFPNGDFIARSNSVERVYRRVNPDDWDDDGIPNDADPAPLVPADTPQFGPHQTLPERARTNNYYWVDLVVPHANARVTFTGCGVSNLPDPSFVAKAGETNRVVLLLGKSYTVDCRLPLVCAGASHPDVAVGEDRDGRLTVCRPVRCEIVDDSPVAAFRASTAAPHAASDGRHVRFTPDPDGSDVTWNGNYCCLEPPPPPFTVPLFNCDGNCGCGGCAAGTYTCRFEGFELSFPNWPCGCSHESPPDEPHEPREDEEDHEPQGPSVSARFSESAIIFEDAYENAPGETVARRSTVSEAEFSVFGGTKGGSYSLELRDGGRLERAGGSFLPREGKLEPGESFKIKVKYQARSASGSEGDIKAVATFTEEESGEEITSKATLTAVKVIITPVVTREGFPNRHKMGVREDFTVEFAPSDISRTIQLSSDWLLSKDSPSDGYTCPIRATADGACVRISGVEYKPSLTVIEPTGILCASGFNRCTDGVIAMELEPYILPRDVSFFGVKVMEVPTTGNVPVGYFSNPLFEPIWNHTKERAAGVWHRPRMDNFFFADVPSFGEYCPPPLSNGVIDWEIPLAWGERSALDERDLAGRMKTVYHQVFTLDATGGLRIDKFSQWIHCSAEGYVTYSPGIR